MAHRPIPSVKCWNFEIRSQWEWWVLSSLPIWRFRRWPHPFFVIKHQGPTNNYIKVTNLSLCPQWVRYHWRVRLASWVPRYHPHHPRHPLRRAERVPAGIHRDSPCAVGSRSSPDSGLHLQNKSNNLIINRILIHICQIIDLGVTK